MKGKDYQKQRNEWRKKGWSIPDLRGSKQLKYDLVRKIVAYVGKEENCHIGDTPIIEDIPDIQPLKEYLPFLKEVGLLQKRSDMVCLTETGKCFAENKVFSN